MKKRTYTVSNVLGKLDTPMIKITGKWLVDKGINIGDKFEMVESQNMIILTKIPKHILEEQNKQFQICELEQKLKYLKNN